MGLSTRPRAIAEGCGELLTTAAGAGRERLTTCGAAGAVTFFGGAGANTGAGVDILTTAGLGTSGVLILGGSILTTGGLGSGLGIILGRSGSGSFIRVGNVRIVIFLLSSIVFFAAAPRRRTSSAIRTFKTVAVNSELLLCFPLSRTPKCLNCSLSERKVASRLSRSVITTPTQLTSSGS